ncbi:14 kDa phosphohistidine phosphatase-like [Rhynchophorus ferrugineus]|uniref:14 kDa phosphohistidine phosphatase-like n=1 Tax=Rhynchophorus ferrugineus TaxID=354439 RepID=UPI003FCCFB55
MSSVVKDVDIDESRCKYILIDVTTTNFDNTVEKKLIVRGYVRCNYHADIFDVVTEEMNAMTENKFKKYKMSVLGGGRINVEKEKKTIEVYGYSVGYGKADHEKTAEVLKTKYPDFTITCSDDGY